MFTRGFLLAVAIFFWYIVGGVVASLSFASIYTIGYLWVLNLAKSRGRDRETSIIKVADSNE